MTTTTPSSYQSFYDISRFVLWADSPGTEETGRKANLRLGFRDGNPRFIVNTGVPGRDGNINFPMDIPHFVSIISMLKDIANGPNGSQINVDSLAPVYVDNKATAEKSVVSVLHIGKTSAGVIYMSLTSENKPKIVFPIRASKFHIFRDNNKQVITDDVISKHMTLGIVEALLTLVGSFMLQYTRDEYTNGERKPFAIVGRNEVAKPAVRQPTGFEDLDAISI